MQKLIWQNSKGEEINLTSGHYGITNWQGFSEVSLNVQSQTVPFQDGSVYLDALLDERELSVTLAIQDNNDLELRYQLRRELIHALNPKLGEGYLIYTNDFISKRIKCVANVPVFENHNSNDTGTPKASLTWTACEPYWEDLEEKFVNFSLGEIVSVDNQGDVSTEITARFFTQDATNPVIENKTTQQKIEVDTNLTKTLNINTNVGQKKVYTENVNLEIIGCYGEFRNICFSKNKSMWVAVTSDNAIFYSYNGTDWNICEFDTDVTANFQGITYSEDLDVFVAVGGYRGGLENCKLASSSDGIHWVNRGNYARELNAVTFSKKLQTFIAVGNQRIIASTDGIEWVEKARPVDTFHSIVYSETLEMFIAVGDVAFFSSVDGETWNNIITSDMYGTYFYSVIFSERLGLFVAVGAKWIDSVSYFVCVTSTDGVDWNVSILTNLGALYPISVVYGEDLGLFVCVGRNYAILTSSDASNWTIIENSGNTNEYYRTVAYSKEQKKFISAGTASKIIESTNGVNWNITQNEKANLNGVAYSKKLNLYIAVGNKGDILSSQDGNLWKKENSNTDADLKAVTYAESLGIFVVVGNKFLISEDGEIWEEVYTMSNTMSSIVYAERLHLFIACGYGGLGQGVIIKSVDGINWENITGISNLSACYSIAFSEEKCRFVIGSEGQIVTSNNGIDWIIVSLPVSGSSIYNITYSVENNLFFILMSDKIIKSEDGLNWYQETISTYIYVIKCVVYSPLNKTFFTINSNGEIYTSINLRNWDKIQNTGTELYSASISIKDNVIVFVGKNGIIMRSYYSEGENKIAYLNINSDMNFKLKNGENRIILLCQKGDFSCSLAYRQKYIGV